jgi:hypothetical protein
MTSTANTTSKLIRATVCAAVATAITAAPAPAQSSQDLRSPDARDAAVVVQRAPGASGSRDLRSPDARDAGVGVQRATVVSGSRDLRSPDARDAAVGVQRAPDASGYQDLRSQDARDAAAKVLAASRPTAAVHVSATARGFDWGSALIGAAAALGLMVLSFAAATRSRRLTRRSVAG